MCFDEMGLHMQNSFFLTDLHFLVDEDRKLLFISECGEIFGLWGF